MCVCLQVKRYAWVETAMTSVGNGGVNLPIIRLKFKRLLLKDERIFKCLCLDINNNTILALHI